MGNNEYFNGFMDGKWEYSQGIFVPLYSPHGRPSAVRKWWSKSEDYQTGYRTGWSEAFEEDCDG